MNRKEFVKNCGLGCMGLLIAPALLQNCGGTKYIDAGIEGSDIVVPLTAFEINKDNGIEGSDIVVPLTAFEINKDNETQYRRYVVVQNEKLEYPICVYRFSSEKYQALWMKCTHQGTELHVFGDKLQCPAHGSEFANTGAVQNGPAAEPLRTFPIAISSVDLKISLR
jgi:Rieske Fe-S protein